MFSLPELLIRLLIGVLVMFVGEKVIALFSDATIKQIASIILVVAVVLYIVFGAALPFR